MKPRHLARVSEAEARHGAAFARMGVARAIFHRHGFGNGYYVYPIVSHKLFYLSTPSTPTQIVFFSPCAYTQQARLAGWLAGRVAAAAKSDSIQQLSSAPLLPKAIHSRVPIPLLIVIPKQHRHRQPRPWRRRYAAFRLPAWAEDVAFCVA